MPRKKIEVTEKQLLKPRKPKKELPKTNKEVSSDKSATVQALPEKQYKAYIKHILECNCVLPQYKNISPPIFHKFIVFSELNKEGLVKTSYINCNNCNVAHKILEAGKSEILKKENSTLTPTTQDIETNLTAWLTALLKQYDCPLPTWQEAQFIIENEQWGKILVLSREPDQNNKEKHITKYVILIGENLYKIKIDQEEDIDD